MCEHCELDKQQLVDFLLCYPQPCIVCKNTKIVVIGTWMADDKTILAVGSAYRDRLIAFCLCEVHGMNTKENEQIIRQAILRAIREDNGLEV